MTSSAKLAPEMTVEVIPVHRPADSFFARVASVVDAGVVLARPSGDQEMPADGSRVRVIATFEQGAHETRGTIAGSSASGLAIELTQGWRALERRDYPRAAACIPFRYKVLNEVEARRVDRAIRSRLPNRSVTSRVSEYPHEKNDLAQVHARLQRIEKAIELLTDLVLWAGTAQAPFYEKELDLSASGLSFCLTPPAKLAPETIVEVEFLLPLSDAVRVRATAHVVRQAEEQDAAGPVGLVFQCITEADRDEVARYVFQLQRRRQVSGR
jgi:hypothetical protein